MLDFNTFYQLANMLKGYALAIGVAVAIGFVWLWWINRQREHAEERNARARAAFSRYLALSLQHPELAEPVLGGPAEMLRYKSFVASLLAVADEVLILAPSLAWRETLVRHLVPHRSLLASREFQDAGYRDCTAEVRVLIDQVVRAEAPARVLSYPELGARGGEPLRQSGPRANMG
jgi:hypothetical protein